MDDRLVLLPLKVEEAPDIDDALVFSTVHMRAVLDWQRDAQAASLRVAGAAERGDLAELARAMRDFARVPPSAERMARIARDCLTEYDAGAVPALPDPSLDARTRRALLKVAPWMEKVWLPRHAPPVERVAIKGRPMVKAAVKACRKRTRDILSMTDAELVRLAADPRPEALSARRLMVADRNTRAQACRDCGGCRMAREAVTEAIPLL